MRRLSIGCALLVACSSSPGGGADAPGAHDGAMPTDGTARDAPPDTASPAPAWLVQYSGGSLGSLVDALAVDAAGNVYLTGAMTGTIDLGGGSALTSAGSTDILVASFTNAGAYRWARVFGGTDIDQGAGIAVAGGTVHVIGNFIGTAAFGSAQLTSAGRTDIVVLALDAATGVPQAAARYGTPNDDTGIAIGVDASGDVAIGGFFSQGTLALGSGSLVGAGEDNGFVASLTASGGHRWSRLLAGSGATDLSSCQQLAVDPGGGVIAAGSFSGTVAFGAGAPVTASDSDAFVASYSSTGAPRWARTFGGTSYDSTDAVAVAASGDVFAGGSFVGAVNFGTGSVQSTGTTDGFVLQLAGSDGSTVFARDLGASSVGRVRSVHPDGAGELLVSGYLEGSANFGTGALPAIGTGGDLFVARFAHDTGTAQLARRLGATEFAEANGIAAGTGGAIVIAGDYQGSGDLGTGSATSGSGETAFVLSFAP